jgi:hypothetical protein
MVVLSIFCYYFLVFKINEARGMVIDNKLKLEEAERKEDYLLSLKSNISDTSGLREKLNLHFVFEDTIADFLGYIETMGENLNLKTTTVSLGIDKGMLGVGISIDGSFEDIYHFLELCEQMPYHVDMEKVYLSYGGSNWRADIILKVISFQ